MKSISHWFGRVVAVLAVIAGGLVAFAAPASAATICGNSPVPPGQVIVSERSSNSCGGYLGTDRPAAVRRHRHLQRLPDPGRLGDRLGVRR
ncbi:hypothetical protein [Kitasatospora sp. MBT66]|uniref:hypothetical protein n=1 Tax=Kitasatospora sp. MBT66 TaxID=1444769 RepID=UPI000AA808C4|nr:hypothetical protein [Kitasatospora sp. MBT66]